MFFDNTKSYPRLFSPFYKTLEEFIQGLEFFESKFEEMYAEHPDYTMSIKSYMTPRGGYIIEIKVNKVK